MTDPWGAGSSEDNIARLIKMKARKLRQCPEYRIEEPDDIEQELRFEWLEIRALYDPRRGSLITYADVALNNHIRNMIAKRRAQKRGGCPIPAEDDEHSLRRIAGSPSSSINSGDDPEEPGEDFDFDAVALKIDVRRALRKLRSDRRRVAEGLTEDGVTEVAKTLKLSRTTVYKRIHELRLILKDLGLEDYLR